MSESCFASASFPHGTRAGLFGELADGNIPQGYFEAFPFTNWTLFDPVHYKITRLSATVHEAGGFAEALCPIKKASRVTLGGLRITASGTIGF